MCVMMISYSAEQCGHLKMVMVLALAPVCAVSVATSSAQGSTGRPKAAILRPDMAGDPKSFKETALEAENADLRDLLAQAGSTRRVS